MREHQETKETDKEKLLRLIKEAELDTSTIIKARDAVWAALPYRFNQEKKIRQEANNLIGELFAGSLADEKIHSADVIKLLADPLEADAWVQRIRELPDSFFLTEGAQTIRTEGEHCARLLFYQENDGNV